MCRKEWQKTDIWTQIERVKQIFVEPRNRKEFTCTMRNYYRQINNETMNGAIFMAVCRGKVSEGLDFADINGRAVIITGLPLAPCFEPKVRLKKNYMQKRHTADRQSLSGDQWYQLEASRAVNQAIGRVIRHRRDFGAILLCDSRFCRATQQSQLSQWVQQHIPVDSSRRSFDIITDSITQFFRDQQSNGSSSDSSPVEATSQEETRAANVADDSGVPNNESPSRTINGNNQEAAFESPITLFARQISALPLSTPSPSTSSENTPNGSARRTADDSNGTPSKRHCSANLSLRFYDEQ